MPQIVQQGALNTTALSVPDLYVQIIPPQYLLNGVPTNVLGIVGSASWGPVNQPVIVGSPAQYASLFGPIMNRQYDAGTSVAIAALQGAANFRVVRVTDGTDAAATAAVDTTGLTITAKYTGTVGNSIAVTIGTGTAPGSYAITVGAPGLVSEVYNNITGSGNAFWVNAAAAINNGNGPLRGPSQLVVAVAGASTSAPTAGVTTLSGGADGAASVTSADMVGNDVTPRTGMYALRKQGCSVALLADCYDSTTWTTQEAFGLSEGVYMVTTSAPGSAIQNGSNGTVDLRNSAGLNSYAVKLMHGDWLYWNDPTNQVVRLVSPQPFAAGILSNLSPQNSSLNKEILGVIGSQKSGLLASQNTTYAQAELQELFTSGIDVICNPVPGGSYWGCRGGFNTSSNTVISDDSYTRMTNYIASTLAAGMGIYVGQTISTSLFNQITTTLSSFFANLVQGGLLDNTYGTPYSVVCNTSNNPQAQTALGYVTAQCQVRYMGINKFFVVNLEGGSSVVVNQGNTTLASNPATPVQ